MEFAGSNPSRTELPVFGFMHIATHGRWREIVAEQFALMRSSGLYERASKIFVGIVGDGCDDFGLQDEKVEVIHRSKEVREFEFPTLQKLHEFSGGLDCLLFYLHTKGVFNDTPATMDWRRYMEHFVVERHLDCIAALQNHDVCGVNWLQLPWAHFSGNFWWARSTYVRRLPHIDTLDCIHVMNHERRHICERWIGTGEGVRAATLHQSHINHYETAYPREMYAGKKPAVDSVAVCAAAPSLRDGIRSWLNHPGGADIASSPLRIAMIFDNSIRPDTTGFYCLRAMWQLAGVSHFLPSELPNIPAGAFDLYLYIDDGLDYELRADLHPSAMWAIDTHLNPQRLIRRARAADTVFCAQRDGVDLLRSNGVNCIGWLPLACEPEIHRRHAVQTEYDACFVGHLSTAGRLQIAAMLGERFPQSFVGQRFFDEMARTYSASRIVLNSSVRNDINMRLFEALSCGSMLITNDLKENGLDELFQDRLHLVTSVDGADLEGKIQYFLDHPAERESIAAAGQAEVLRSHTYVHRMRTILNCTLSRREANPPPLTSIVVVTFNASDHTKACLVSIAANTPEPHEIIVVDNGSTDGTIEFLRENSSVRLIENEANRGFAAAANQGMIAAGGERIVLLNNDVVVTPAWLAELQAALDSSSDIGLVGPCSNSVSGIQQIPVDYSELSGITEFAEDWTARHSGRIWHVDRLVGFCLLFRRTLLDDIGFLDEQFGIGNFEDDDFCRRARLAGFRTVIARGSFVHHFGSATFRENGIDHGALMRRNQALYLQKWAAAPSGGRDRACDEMDPFAAHRPRLSVCMIVRDNARTLRAGLQSIQPWVDEIVVVDTGSTDETPSIAIECGARLLHFPWCDDFAKARNCSLEAARGDWLFWMDSDDTIDETNGRRLREIAYRDHSPSVMGFVMQVRCPSGRSDSDEGYATDTVVDHIKLIRNHQDLRFEGRIHEQILPSIRRLGGEVEWADVEVVHSGSDASEQGRARKHDRDLRLLELELEDKPDDTFALFNLGMTFLDAGRAAEALAPLCRSLQLAEPGESHVRKIYSLIAQTYNDLGRRETSLKTCRQGLNVCPGDPELLFRAGVLEQAIGSIENAERAFRQLLEATHERHFSSIDGGILGIKAWHNLGILYDRQRRYAEGAHAWERVLSFDLRNRTAWRALLDSLSAARDLAALRRAAVTADRADVPDEIRVMVKSRIALLTDGADGAIDELRTVAMAPDSSVNLLSELCEVAFTHGRLEAAEDALLELSRRNPVDASARLNLASICLKRAQYGKAAEYARQSLELRPGHPFAHHVLEQASSFRTEAELEMQPI